VAEHLRHRRELTHGVVGTALAPVHEHLLGIGATDPGEPRRGHHPVGPDEAGIGHLDVVHRGALERGQQRVVGVDLAVAGRDTEEQCMHGLIVVAAPKRRKVTHLQPDWGMRLGIAHHLGWAVAVTASDDHQVVDRRRIELIEAGLPAAPVHHEGGPHEMHRSGPPLDDRALTALVTKVRASVTRATAVALDELVAALPAPVASIAVRDWPDDFPDDIAVQRRVPYESRADSVMYCQVLAELARERGWTVCRYDAKRIEAEAARILGTRADEVLRGPRATLGPPWSKDHRMALAATIVC
jgi:hypothetical protein